MPKLQPSVLVGGLFHLRRARVGFVGEVEVCETLARHPSHQPMKVSSTPVDNRSLRSYWPPSLAGENRGTLGRRLSEFKASIPTTAFWVA